jgi:hypothetical protein
MGKASRRKRQQRNADHRERGQAAGNVPAPNFEGAAVEAARYALAMVTSVHASPEDLPSLTEDLADNRALQGMVAYALLSQLIMVSARELADARGTTLVDALNYAMEGLAAGEHEDSPVMTQALGTVHAYAEVLNGTRQPETVVADLDANLGKGQAGLSYVITLSQIAHAAIAARCAEIGEDVASYLQRISLPAAEAHGNEIEAEAVEDYVDALISGRLATEPLLLTHAAEALRSGSVTLPEDDADEFHELGGSARLEELADDNWDDLDPEDQRLVVIALLESIMVDPEGDTVADRLEIIWRF